MSTSTKPIDPKTKERSAELIGLGLSHREAARATGISERSGERLMSQPGYRKIAEEVTRGGGVHGEVEQEIRDLLSATHEDGTPNLVLRGKGVEMWFELEGVGDPLPSGVIRVYPTPPKSAMSGAAPD
ncbi:MAG TPA: hypothetical protein VIP09_06970 [Dehalococcoidia bacterium]